MVTHDLSSSHTHIHIHTLPQIPTNSLLTRTKADLSERQKEREAQRTTLQLEKKDIFL